jgi:hypothetical protein
MAVSLSVLLSLTADHCPLWQSSCPGLIAKSRTGRVRLDRPSGQHGFNGILKRTSRLAAFRVRISIVDRRLEEPDTRVSKCRHKSHTYRKPQTLWREILRMCHVSAFDIRREYELERFATRDIIRLTIARHKWPRKGREGGEMGCRKKSREFQPAIIWGVRIQLEFSVPRRLGHLVDPFLQLQGKVRPARLFGHKLSVLHTCPLSSRIPGQGEL